MIKHRINAVVAGAIFVAVQHLTFKAQHQRHVRAINISIQNTDLSASLGQSHGNVGRNGAFADTALAAGYGNHIAHARNGLTIRQAHGLGRFGGDSHLNIANGSSTG